MKPISLILKHNFCSYVNGRVGNNVMCHPVGFPRNFKSSVFGLVFQKSERRASRPRVGDGGTTRSYKGVWISGRWIGFVDKRTLSLWIQFYDRYS